MRIQMLCPHFRPHVDAAQLLVICKAFDAVAPGLVATTDAVPEANTSLAGTKTVT
jgi:hypothetical protein